MAHKFFRAPKLAALAAFWAVLALPVLATVTVTKTAELSFGKFVPGVSVGTVTISTSGARSAGGVILFNQASAQQAAVFTVSGGTGGASCTLTVPTSVPAPLTGAGASMALSSFYASDASNSLRLSPPDSTVLITLDGFGSYTVKVGASLTVGAHQIAGNYASTFSVSVTCP